MGLFSHGDSCRIGGGTGGLAAGGLVVGVGHHAVVVGGAHSGGAGDVAGFGGPVDGSAALGALGGVAEPLVAQRALGDGGFHSEGRRGVALGVAGTHRLGIDSGNLGIGLGRERGGDAQIFLQAVNDIRSVAADRDDAAIHNQLIQVIALRRRDLDGDAGAVVHGAAALNRSIRHTIYGARNGDCAVCTGGNGDNRCDFAGAEGREGGIAAIIGNGHAGLDHGAAAAGEGDVSEVIHLAGSDGGNDAPLHQVAAAQVEGGAIAQHGLHGEGGAAVAHSQGFCLRHFPAAGIDGQAGHLAQGRVDHPDGTGGLIPRRVGGGEGEGVADGGGVQEQRLGEAAVRSHADSLSRAVHRQLQGLAIRPTGEGDGAAALEEGAADGRGHQKGGRRGVHREALGVQEGVALAVGTLEGDGVGTFGQTGKGHGNAVPVGYPGLRSAVQAPGAGDVLVRPKGDDEVAGGIEQGGEGVSARLGDFRNACRVGAPGKGGRVGLGDGHAAGSGFRRPDYSGIHLLVGGHAHGVGFAALQTGDSLLAGEGLGLLVIHRHLKPPAGGVGVFGVLLQHQAADAGDQIPFGVIEVDPVAVNIRVGDGEGHLVVPGGLHGAYLGRGGLVGIGVGERYVFRGNHGLLAVRRNGLKGVVPGGQGGGVHGDGDAGAAEGPIFAGHMTHHAGVVGILLVHRQQGDLGELLQAGAGDGGAAVRHTDAVDARQGRHPVESQTGGLAGGDGVGTGPVGLEGHGHVGLMGRGIIGHLGVGVFGGAGVGHILDKGQGIIADGDGLGLLPGLFQAGAVPGEGQGGGRGVAGSQVQLVLGTLNIAFQAVLVGPRGGNGAGHQAQLGLGGQGGVGAHHGVKGPAGVGSGVYGYGGQTQQVGVVGCGGVAAPADLAAAPVVGDAHLDAQGLGGAPDLFRVDAHAHVGQGETADERQGAGQAQGGPDEELENAALIQHQIAAALKDARDVHIHRGQEEELGVPVKLQAGAVQHGHGVGQHAVAQLRADALEAQGQRGPGRDDLEDGELRLQNELEGRN